MEADVQPRHFDGLDALRAAAGSHLGVSGWRTVSQAQIDQFAAATGDHQWIHVDPERAKAGPFGGTVAHGFLTLSLIPALLADVYSVSGVSMAVNYGLDRVRFPAPTLSGSRVRASVDLVEARDVTGGLQVSTEVTVEAEGRPKPVCVAVTLARFYA
jgi:acyl dehydratase